MDDTTIRTITYHLEKAIESHDIDTPNWLNQIIESIYSSGDTMLSHGQKMVFFFLRTDEDILYYPNHYDKEVREKFDERVKSGQCVIDVGASIGYYTLRAADLVGEQGTVYAFEPEQSRYEALKKSISINELEDIVTTSNNPVADTQGEINIRERRGQEEWTSRTAEATTLDSVVAVVQKSSQGKR